MKTILSIALLTNLISCGKEMSQQKPTSFSSSHALLMGKSDEEIILLKYNNEIQLKCDLRVQPGKDVDLNFRPDSSFTWKLNRELISSKTLNFSLHGKEYRVLVRLDSPVKILPELTYPAVDGREYRMEFTPSLDIRYEVLTKEDFENGVRSDRESMAAISLPENIEVPLYTLTSELVSSPGAWTEDFRCTLEAQALPKYKNQWQKK